MKTKCFAMLALIFCMSLFLFPAQAYATEDAAPLTVTATPKGEILRIEVSGGVSGVEAIFVNEQRFNFRVDGALSVDLLAFKDFEMLSVHAVDFAGNMSNIVTVENPQYVGQTSDPPDQGIPVTTSRPFTPDGQASVLDNAKSDDEKEFFTFQTPDGNVFYLVVDRQRGADNVYFLNAVTEQDLIALAEQSGEDIPSGSGGIPVATTPKDPDGQTDEPQGDEPEPPPDDTEEKGGNGTLVFMLVAVAVAGGAGYYFKIVRPKRQGGNGDYEDEDNDEDDIGDEMEFEDEPANGVADEERGR